MDKNHPANIILQLKLDVYFKLTLNQKRRLNSIGHSWNDLHTVSVQDLKRITNSSKLESDLIRLKQLTGLRLVA